MEVMKSYWQYACAKGNVIIGEPGTLEDAKAVRDLNYQAAFNCGDKDRHNYRIVKRRVAYGKWIDND
jgi:hypothetical protein